MLDAHPGERVQHGVHEHRRARRDAGLAAALDAQRIALGRILRQLDVEVRKVIRARHAVVEKACGQKLPRAWLVDRCLHHRLPNSLRHAAVHLAVQNERIDRLAAIVDRRVAADFDCAGLRIDLGLADGGAGRIGAVAEFGQFAGAEAVERAGVGELGARERRSE